MTTVVFAGVTTGSSLIHQALSAWQPILGVACEIRGVDMALDAEDEIYLRFLGDLLTDNSTVGAVITSHKVGVFRAGRTMFAGLDPLALACEEVNAIRRTPDGLRGWGRDPISVGRVADQIWPESEGEVVCLGAGGTACALAQHVFATREPVRFVCADPTSASVERLAQIAGHPVDGHVGLGPWDDLVEAAPPGSLIVNATGMGKDRPGSPITGRARFPPCSVVWGAELQGKSPVPGPRPDKGEGLRDSGPRWLAVVLPRLGGSTQHGAWTCPTMPSWVTGSLRRHGRSGRA